TAPAVLAAGETRYPVGARRRRLIPGRCDDQWRATTTAGSLCCACNSTFRPVRRSVRDGGPAPLSDKFQPLRARDAALATRRGLNDQAQVPFFTFRQHRVLSYVQVSCCIVIATDCITS